MLQFYVCSPGEKLSSRLSIYNHIFYRPNITADHTCQMKKPAKLAIPVPIMFWIQFWNWNRGALSARKSAQLLSTSTPACRDLKRPQCSAGCSRWTRFNWDLLLAFPVFILNNVCLYVCGIATDVFPLFFDVKLPFSCALHCTMRLSQCKWVS